MNFPVKKALLSFLLCIAAAWTLSNFSSRNTSGDSAELPKKNFTGTIEGSDNLVYTADHIAIGSRSSTEHIIVYHEPKEPGTRPADYATYLDLANIAEITTAFPSEKERTVTHDAIEYVPIKVLFHDGAKTHQYLIEARKELFCDEIDGTQYIPHALKFTAVKRIILRGSQCNTPAHTSSACKPLSDKEKRKNEHCTHAGKAIDDLTQQVESLPAEQKGAFRSMVNSIRDYVGAMCSTE